MAGGRPRKFKNVEELQESIDAYLERCELKEKPLTMSGLAVACEIDRKTLVNYSKEDEFFLTINKYRKLVLADMEERGLNGDSNATMSIFLLKNNFGYKDKQEVEQTVKNVDDFFE